MPKVALRDPVPSARRAPPYRHGPTRAALRLVLALLALLWALPALAGLLTVDVLDVGQGDAILIRTADKAVLIDAGPRNGQTLQQLRTLGVRSLDLVVATHPHADHIGGMVEVLNGVAVGLYLDNGQPHTTRTYDQLMRTVEEKGLRYRTAERDLRLNLGEEATLTVLFPAAEPLRDTRSDHNANSVVLLLEHGEVRFLFAGDAEPDTEEALLELGLPTIDVLKVAHHGSNYSSTLPFLNAIAPRYALISSGENNRYGHPGPQALRRLAQVGAMVYRTDQSGNLRVISDGEQVEVLEGSLAELARVQIRAGRPAPAEAQGPPSRAELRQLKRQQRIERRAQRQAERRARKEAR